VIAELTREETEEFLREQVVGRIGCHADGQTYVVPVIYAYDDGYLYVATIEGRKTRMLRANPEVCFEVDRYDGPAGWRSAIAWGTYEELAGEEAERAIAILAERFGRTGETRRHGPESGLRTVCFRIRVEELTGRAVERSA